MLSALLKLKLKSQIVSQQNLDVSFYRDSSPAQEEEGEVVFRDEEVLARKRVCGDGQKGLPM